MQKLFENWRRYAEAKDWDPNTSGRAAPRGIPDGADSPTPPDVDPAALPLTPYGTPRSGNRTFGEKSFPTTAPGRRTST